MSKWLTALPNWRRCETNARAPSGELWTSCARLTTGARVTEGSAEDCGEGAGDLGLAPAANGSRQASQPSLETSFTAPAAPAVVVPAAAHDPERMEIERVLVESGGVIATAAALLGISRQALYRRMDRLGIELERRPKA